VVHSFGGDVTQPTGVFTGVIQGRDGQLYGTTDGGANGCCGGTVYRLGLLGLAALTPTGNDVIVPLSTGVITFQHVSLAGNTIMTTITSGPPPPQGFSLASVIFDVQTTAAFIGPVEVCLPLPSGSDPTQLSLLHHHNNAWVDVTTSRDTVNAVICGQVTSLSPFAVALRLPELTALGPARIWMGLKNSDSAGLRLDLKVDVFLNSTSNAPIGTGVLNNVSGGSSGFSNAVLSTVTLGLTGGPVAFSSGDTLLFRLSVRRTCSGGGHASGTVRLWYNGNAVDSGLSRDAGSRFDAAINETTNSYFLRNGFALTAAAGSSRLFIDRTVNSTVVCPNRPFASIGTWSATPP